MNRNEPDPTKRKTGNFPIWDVNGRLRSGLTFLTANGEVIISLDKGAPGPAAADGVGAARGLYFYQASQAETNHLEFQVWLIKKAIIDLATYTTNCTTKVRAKLFGIAGNDFNITFVQDAGAPNIGALTKTDAVSYLYTFKGGVTTVANYETAIGASTDLEVATVGAAHVLVAGVDEFGPKNLVDGVEGSYTQPLDQYEPGLDTKLDEIIALLGTGTGAHASCPLGADASNGDMVLEARLGGTAGNDITITFVNDAGGGPMTLSEVGSAITVHTPEATQFSSDLETLINSDSTLARVKTSDSNPSTAWGSFAGGPYAFSGGTNEAAGIVDANVVEWKGVPPLNLDANFRVQASVPFDVVDIAAAVWNAVAESSDTYGDFMRLFRSILSGTADGFDTGTIHFRSANGAVIRLTVVTNATGRLTVTPGPLTP